jgi:hypothetical protein
MNDIERAGGVNIPGAVRGLFAGTDFTFIGFAIADMLDRDFDIQGDGEYATTLRLALGLIREAAKMRSQRT